MPSPPVTPGLQLNELVLMDADAANVFEHTSSSLAYDDEASIDIIGGFSDNILPSTRSFYMSLPPHHEFVDNNATLFNCNIPNNGNNNNNNKKMKMNNPINNTTDIITTNSTNRNSIHALGSNNEKPVVFLLFLK